MVSGQILLITVHLPLTPPPQRASRFRRIFRSSPTLPDDHTRIHHGRDRASSRPPRRSGAGCLPFRRSRPGGPGSSDLAPGAAGLERRRRLHARHLHPAHRLVEEARRRVGPDAAGLDREDRRGPRPVDGDHHGAGQLREARPLPRDLRPAGPRRGAHRRAGARTGTGGQGGGLDRRGPPRHRGARRAPAHGARVADGEPERRGDDAAARRRHPARGPRQSRRDGAGVVLVHAERRSQEALDRRPAPALPEVHRARQQPRFLPQRACPSRRTSAG